MAFTAFAVKGEQLAYELGQYKSGRAERARHDLQLRLSALLWRWLADHENCLAYACGEQEFDTVTAVPSARGRVGDHPLQRMLAEIVGPTRERYRDLLAADLSVPQGRDPDVRRWRITSQPAGDAVLLIDDTWTTGAHAQSAAAALKAAGARKVAFMAVGRHFNRDQQGDYREAAEAYYRRAKKAHWTWDRCCLE